MKFDVTEPFWLALLVPALAWVGWLAWSSDVQQSPGRRGVSLTLRVAAVLAVVLALAGLRWMHPVKDMNVLFLLDVSDSVPPRQQAAAREQIREFLQEKPAADGAGLIVFGAEAGIESTASRTFEVPRSQAVVVPSERTDLAGALRLAAAALPEYGERRVVLFSDGNENVGDAFAAALSVRGVGAAVDVVPLGQDRGLDVAVERLQLPPRVREQVPFEARVLVTAGEAGPATVTLFRNDQLLGQQEVQLDAGHNLLTFPQTLSAPGFHAYDVRVDVAADNVPQNNRASGFVWVRGIPRVLLVTGDPEADSLLAGALQSSELELRVIDPAQFPDSLAELHGHDAIITSNVAATDLTRTQQQLLQSAVRDFGVGWVCIGGDQAFAAGGYKGTPLDETLPVESDLSSRKVFPSGALILVIDRSGSMTGEKLEMARQSAWAAVELLTRHDYVGVIAFDGAPSEVVPLQRITDPGAVGRAIAGIDAGGGTVMGPALRMALDRLKEVPASLKHVVVLTDGQSHSDDFEGIANAMAAERITLSTVGLGTDCDVPLMQRLASLGRGRFYHVPWPTQLPQIFLQETAVILKTAIDENPFTPQISATTEPIRGLGQDYPPLLGHVVTMPRPRAELALSTEQGDPLLAHWQFGLGRAVAFTSDARSRWAQNWTGWDRYRQFWQQVLQWSLRRLDNAEFTTQIAIDRGIGQLAVEALDAEGGFRNFLNLEAAVVGPKGDRQRIRLEQTGPGRYEARFATRETGTYLLNLLELERGEPVASQVVGASLSYSPEFAERTPNLNLLRRIAEATGGKELIPGGHGANPFLYERKPSWQPQELWEHLLRLAVVLVVLDVGCRRVQIDTADWRRFGEAALAFLGIRGRDRRQASDAAPSLSALLARRKEDRGAQAPPSEAVVASFQPQRPGVISSMPPSEPEPSPAAPPPPESSSAPEPQSPTSRLLEAKRRARR